MTNKTASTGLPAYTRLLLAGAAVGALALATPAFAAGTPANTKIENTASATYTTPEGPETETSNKVEIFVDEILDVDVEWEDTAEVDVLSPSSDNVLEFSVTNAGNGPEAFELTVDNSGGDDFDPSGWAIYLDDGDGVYTDGDETLYSGNTGEIDADDSIVVWVVSTIPAGQAEDDTANLDLLAEAATGTGDPGDSFAGAGEGGVDAVVGMTGADDNDVGTYVVYEPMTPTVGVTLLKAQDVEDQWGTALVVPGATITYTLTATVTGTGSISGFSINDSIPDDTDYVPESLTLQVGSGTVDDDLTDATGDDAAEIDGDDITFDIGTANAGDVFTATFQVTIADD